MRSSGDDRSIGDVSSAALVDERGPSRRPTVPPRMKKKRLLPTRMTQHSTSTCRRPDRRRRCESATRKLAVVRFNNELIRQPPSLRQDLPSTSPPLGPLPSPRYSRFDGSEHSTVHTTNVNSVGEKCRPRLKKVHEFGTVLPRNLDNVTQKILRGASRLVGTGCGGPLSCLNIRGQIAHRDWACGNGHKRTGAQMADDARSSNWFFPGVRELLILAVGRHVHS